MYSKIRGAPTTGANQSVSKMVVGAPQKKHLNNIDLLKEATLILIFYSY
jgi:hypothetical protein